MNKQIIYLILFLLFSIHILFAQERVSSPIDTLKKSTNDSSHKDLGEKINLLQSSLDSLSIVQTSLSNRVYTLEERLAGNKRNMMIAYALGGLGILLAFISLGYTSSKVRLLKDRIYAATNRHDVDDLEKKYYENKKRVNESIDDMSARYNSFYAEFNKAKEVLVNEIAELCLKVDASSSLTKSIETSTKKQEDFLSSQQETNTFGKPKTFLVEYFVDNGEIKFKETNSGTPFYMDQYDDRAELTVNEATYAPSNYSESIQKCFKVNGEMSGKYRNKKPALCSYDENLNTWNLIQMGELDAL